MRLTLDGPSTLLEALARLLPESSRTTLRQLLASGRVRVDGEIEKKGARRLGAGSVIDLARKEHHARLPPEVALLHEDDDLIVVVKPPGLLTVATEAERERTLQAHLNAFLKSDGRGERIHVVHRLDLEASGVLVFARSFEMRERMKTMFAAHAIERVYAAIVEGAPEPPDGTVRSHLREGSDLTVRSVDPWAFPGARPAVTHYRTIESGARFSRVEVTLETGRRNQIRVHMAEMGHPIAGDARYGAASDPLG
ncbi:MAG TPA: RluA family pseudouridine synthase, partial [Thermoanaerobaculia bacterium]|nr:RluA family pseudouridine synthase [Thermoanaerobaculia bacterium]